jgi:hypothetical protein
MMILSIRKSLLPVWLFADVYEVDYVQHQTRKIDPPPQMYIVRVGYEGDFAMWKLRVIQKSGASLLEAIQNEFTYVRNAEFKAEKEALQRLKKKETTRKQDYKFLIGTELKETS